MPDRREQRQRGKDLVRERPCPPLLSDLPERGISLLKEGVVLGAGNSH